MIPIFFTFGAQDFPGHIKGFESNRFYCPRCHNVSVVALKERKFFTICFIPLIPIAWGKRLHCTICNWSQPTSVAELEQMTQNNPPSYSQTNVNPSQYAPPAGGSYQMSANQPGPAYNGPKR